MRILTLLGIDLFRGLSEQEMEKALDVFRSEEKTYEKDSAILLAGDKTDRMGLVLEGSVRIETNDYWGNRTILSLLVEGGYFAETFAYLKDEVVLVDVVANEACRVMFLTISNLEGKALRDEPWANQIRSNLLSIAIRKNLMFSKRNLHTSPKLIRGRVMSFLNSYALEMKSRTFTVPFNRRQMADYLNVERTALSKELGKMKKEGLIQFDRNRFSILSSG